MENMSWCLQHTNCQNCKLSIGNIPNPTKTLFARGSHSARIAFVGESPSSIDLLYKRLFAGPSGKLLEQTIQSLGIRNKDLYYTNALLCNYPSGKENRPKKDEIIACKTRLLEEFKKLKDLRVVIAMGNLAIESLIGKNKITKEIFNIYWNDELKVHIIPTFHPAFCLREPEAFPDMIWALETANKLANAPEHKKIQPYPLNLQVAKNADMAVEFLNHLAEIDFPVRIAIDCESDDSNWLTTPMLAIGFCYDGETAFVIPWIYQDNTPYCSSDDDTFFVTPEMTEALGRVAANKNLQVVGHNFSFDSKLIAKNSNVWFDVSDDTMVLHYVLDERGGTDPLEGVGGGTKIGSHRLKSVAKAFLKIPDWEADIKLYIKSKKAPYSFIPRSRLWKYLGYDVVYTWHLKSALENYGRTNEEISTDGNPHPLDCYNNLLMPAYRELIKTEYDGVRVNLDFVTKLDKDMEETLKNLKHKMVLRVRELEGRTGPKAPTLTKTGKVAKNQEEEFNPNSSRHLAKVIYDLLKIKLTPEMLVADNGKKITTARPTARSVLLKLRNRDPIIEDAIQYKLITKRWGTYVHNVEARLDHRLHLHGNLLLTATRTGRLSSRDPNLQNLPKGSEIKQMFIPDDDESVFANCDYKQLEVRVAAYMSRDPNLLAVCKGDIHGDVARKVFAKQRAELLNCSSIEQVTSYIKNIKVLSTIYDNFNRGLYKSLEDYIEACLTELRNKCKFITFGVIYGREAFSLANGELSCSPQEAQGYIDSFFTEFSVLNSWLNKQQSIVKTRQWLETEFGRRRRFPLLTDDFLRRVLKQTVNAPIQSYASDVCLAAFTQIAPYLRENELGRVKFPVHDAIAFSLKKKTLIPALNHIKYVMENTTKPKDVDVKFEVDQEVGFYYGAKTSVKKFLEQNQNDPFVSYWNSGVSV